MAHGYQKQKNFSRHQRTHTELFQKRNTALFLDFDGTLAEIADHYKNATILKESKKLLKAIASTPECLVAIVSGRALSDVKKRVGLKNIVYAGNHGLEIEGAGIKYTTFVKPSIKNLLKKILHDLAGKIGSIPGILLEDKTLTLSIHFRKVKKQDMLIFQKLLRETMAPYLKAKRVTMLGGKKVFEIKPVVDWDKGKAVMWLLERFSQNKYEKKIYPVFIGDDVTDETAFKALKGKGLCIRVGKNETSSAPYYLRNTEQVAKFLRIVLNSRTRHHQN